MWSSAIFKWLMSNDIWPGEVNLKNRGLWLKLGYICPNGKWIRIKIVHGWSIIQPLFLVYSSYIKSNYAIQTWNYTYLQLYLNAVSFVLITFLRENKWLMTFLLVSRMVPCTQYHIGKKYLSQGIVEFRLPFLTNHT